MKFKKYLKKLKKIAKKRPETLEMKVVYAKDDEGNGFQEIYWGPSIGNFDENEREFISEDSEDWEEEYELTDNDKNALCIN